MLTILTLLTMFNIMIKCNAGDEKIKRKYPITVENCFLEIFYNHI